MIPNFVWPLLFIFILHWLGDWVFQSKLMSETKSESNYVLFLHFLIYTVTLACAIPFLDESLFTRISFIALNGVLHVVFDGSWWRLYKLSVWKREYGTWFFNIDWKERQEGKDKLRDTYEFWNDSVFGYMLGFDQMFHFTCLVLTYFLFF